MKIVLGIVRNTLIMILMAISATHISGCNTNDKIISVSASEFDKEIKDDSVQLLDVRTPQEYAEGHIDGALNINVQSGDFQREAEKELSKDSTILVYCRSGRRSMDAAEQLTKLGSKVVNLNGGIIEWKENGLPVTTKQSTQSVQGESHGAI